MSILWRESTPCWVLESLSALDDPLLLHALRDPHPGVREHTLRMAEPFLGKSPAVTNAALGMTKDPEPRVVFQLALSLGELQDPRSLNGADGNIGSRQQERWFRLAVLECRFESAAEMFEALEPAARTSARAKFLGQLASLIGIKHNPHEVARLLAGLGQAKSTRSGSGGPGTRHAMAEVSELRVPGADAILSRYLQNGSEAVQTAAWEVAHTLS